MLRMHVATRAHLITTWRTVEGLLVVKNRLYSLLVIDVSGMRDDENLEKFFTSLVLQ